MSSGSQPVSTTVQNNDPWGPAQPYLKEIMSGAQNLYKNDTGYNPYPHDTYIPYSQPTQTALDQMTGIAMQGNPLAAPGVQQIGNVIASGGMSQEQNLAQQPLWQSASGQFLENGNPYFNARLDDQLGRVGDQVNREFSAMGRLGSGSHANAMTDRLSAARVDAMSQDYDRERAYQNQAAQSLVNNYAAGQGRMMNAVGMAPGAYNQMFQPSERLARIGAAYEGKDAERLASDLQRWNMKESRPYDQLARYQGLVGGMGQLGGAQVGTQSQPGTSPLLGALGGAAAGGSLFGPIGAVGGGLLGLFG